MPEKNRLTVQWIAATGVGLGVGLVPFLDDNPPARLLAALLFVASVPFGLLRPKRPYLWAIGIAWPTVMMRLNDAGWGALTLFVYTIVGTYIGDWLKQWWEESHPPLPVSSSAGTAAPSAVAADGTAASSDGLPPEMPGRYTGMPPRSASSD